MVRPIPFENPILKRFKHLPTLPLLDGGLSTSLEDHYNLDFYCPEAKKLWSASLLYRNPSLIYEAHVRFLESGADIIMTSTYQASIDGFIRAGFSPQQSEDMLKLSVQICTQARDDYWNKRLSQTTDADATPSSSSSSSISHTMPSSTTTSHPFTSDSLQQASPAVAIALGTYAAYLANGSEYSGFKDIALSTMADFHQRRLSFFLQPELLALGYDFLAIETVPGQDEVQAITIALDAIGNSHGGFHGKPVWVSLSCKVDESNGEVVLCAGDSLSLAIETLNSSQWVDGIGINCCEVKYIDQMLPVVTRHVHPSKAVLCYPNGQSWDKTTGAWHAEGPLSPQQFGEKVRSWQSQGVAIAGGCCKVDFDMIAAVKKEVTKDSI